MNMEQNGSNENLQPALLCRAGCGFYGNPAFESMCSKCYKDMIKRRQQNNSPTGLLSASALSNTVSENTTNMKAINISEKSLSSLTTAVETASPTVPSATPVDSSDKDEEKDKTTQAEAAAVATSSDDSKTPEDEPKKPKKNKCHTCKKKVGLTGFQCRCGGLYCSLHRYSDKHDCQFDYKELAQEEIRKQNPVVVGAKVQKI